MTWGDRRKHLIEAILVIIALAIIAVVTIAVLYKAPSCNDGKQNQGELGVDCGGPCPYACDVSETPPAVEFTRAVSPQSSRVDIIASIRNSNNDVELVNAPYTITIYDLKQNVLAQSTGVATIPPSTTLPLYIPNFYDKNTIVAEAFLTFTAPSYQWLRTSEKPVVPTISNIQIQNGENPRITATLTNPTATMAYDLTVVATVFNAKNNVIGASQTLVTQLPSQGSASIIFTWNQAFPSDATRVEILPVPSASQTSL